MTTFGTSQKPQGKRRATPVCFHPLKILVTGKYHVLLKSTKAIVHNQINLLLSTF